VESGRRVARAVEGAVDDAGRVVVASVVNDYWGYVTTEEEYSRQYYEGGHTLYGPRSQEFVAAQVARLARDASGRPVFADVRPERRWNVGAKRFLPARPSGGAPERRFDRVARFTDPTARHDGHWAQTWVDVEPGGLDWHEPLVRVESSDDDGATWEPAVERGRRIDDQGWALSISHLGSLGDDSAGHRYEVRWHDPLMRVGRRHRFVLLENAGRPEVAGQPFD
jgi:neutral ceramidase